MKKEMQLFYKSDVLKGINSILTSEYGHEKLIYTMSNNQVFLNYKLIDAEKLDDEKIKKTIIDYLKKQDGISFAVDMEKLSVSSLPEPLKTRAINGYNFKRSGDIQVFLEPQWFGFYSDFTGTTHGAWNPYDSHIPLVFMGWGIKQGKTHAPTYMTDIAPTLSALLHIQEPNGNIGQPIVDLLDK